jgi:enamine deaminase RidA (YjgF/YER057c/UK114 family)
MLEDPDVPEPLSGFPYSNVVVSNDLIAVASQTPFDDTNHLRGTGFADQAQQVFANLRRCLQAAGCDLADVIKVGGYLARPDLVGEYTRSTASTSIRPTRPAPPSPARWWYRACSSKSTLWPAARTAPEPLTDRRSLGRGIGSFDKTPVQVQTGCGPL